MSVETWAIIIAFATTVLGGGILWLVNLSTKLTAIETHTVHILAELQASSQELKAIKEEVDALELRVGMLEQTSHKNG